MSLTPRQAVVWLMNLDSISDLYEMTTGEILETRISGAIARRVESAGQGRQRRHEALKRRREPGSRSATVTLR